MTFWLNVGLAYLVLFGVSLSVGAVIGIRRRRRGGGGGGGSSEPVAPAPTGPALALDHAPLGTAFDRYLMPGVSFSRDPAQTR